MKMKLTIGNSYKIVIDINGKILTFSCKIISNEDGFITFIDKFGKTYSYNLNNIISYEEIEV